MAGRSPGCSGAARLFADRIDGLEGDGAHLPEQLPQMGAAHHAADPRVGRPQETAPDREPGQAPRNWARPPGRPEKGPNSVAASNRRITMSSSIVIRASIPCSGVPGRHLAAVLVAERISLRVGQPRLDVEQPILAAVAAQLDIAQVQKLARRGITGGTGWSSNEARHAHRRVAAAGAERGHDQQRVVVRGTDLGLAVNAISVLRSRITSPPR